MKIGDKVRVKCQPFRTGEIVRKSSLPMFDWCVEIDGEKWLHSFDETELELLETTPFEDAMFFYDTGIVRESYRAYILQIEGSVSNELILRNTLKIFHDYIVGNNNNESYINQHQ